MYIKVQELVEVSSVFYPVDQKDRPGKNTYIRFTCFFMGGQAESKQGSVNGSKGFSEFCDMQPGCEIVYDLSHR